MFKKPETQVNIAYIDDKDGETALGLAVCTVNIGMAEMLFAHPKIDFNLKLINEFIDERERERERERDRKLKSLEDKANHLQRLYRLSISKVSGIKNTLKMLRKKAEEFYMEGLSSSYITRSYGGDTQIKNVFGVITELLIWETQN